MKTTANNAIRTGLVLIISILFSACGQKGPLELEEPPRAKTQEEESEQTR